ncbi:MAG: hypothetical protein GY702_01185 [Desulfobulbaceae bacterium]|nr:hypothetical protein [Desulfobulbaceae bacterium]
MGDINKIFGDALSAVYEPMMRQDAEREARFRYRLELIDEEEVARLIDYARNGDIEADDYAWAKFFFPMPGDE